MTQDVYIALDIGGTKFMVAAVSTELKIIARERRDTPRSLDEGIKLLIELSRSVAGGNKVLGIGASCGGPLDYRSGVVSPLHMPEWREVPLKATMESEFHAPLFVDVDTNAAALAEYRFGGHAVQRLMYITLSTGMGGGFVIDGNLYRGVDGAHPEVGHQAVPAEGEPVLCSCGARDCLEALISGTAIQNRYGKPAEKLLPDEWDEIARLLGHGLRNVAAFYAPEVIVLGGGVALGGGARLLSGVQRVLKENVKIVPLPRVVLSELGYDSALWGAVALATATRSSIPRTMSL